MLYTGVYTGCGLYRLGPAVMKRNLILVNYLYIYVYACMYIYIYIYKNKIKIQ